jgi:hypothetical protein
MSTPKSYSIGRFNPLTDNVRVNFDGLEEFTLDDLGVIYSSCPQIPLFPLPEELRMQAERLIGMLISVDLDEDKKPRYNVFYEFGEEEDSSRPITFTQESLNSKLNRLYR